MVESWITTMRPSLVSCTSISTALTPSSSAPASAASVFSGRWAESPRWAITSGGAGNDSSRPLREQFLECRLVPGLDLEENLQQVFVQQTAARILAEDLACPFLRDRLLIGAVRRHECIEDVGDRHHLRLARDLHAPQLPRIPGSVELLVVGIGDVGDVP